MTVLRGKVIAENGVVSAQAGNGRPITPSISI